MLQVDDDWKAQAQREKEKLAERAKADAAAKEAAKEAAAQAAKPAGPAGPRRPEAASFIGLLQSLSTQALMMMGAIADPRSGRQVQDLGFAKSLLDTVTMLEDKTKGNLSPEESNALAATLYELRDTYVRAAWASRSTAVAA